MRTEGINRIVVAVEDIQKARKRFAELLGIEFWHSNVAHKFGLRAMVSWDGGLELVSPIDPQSSAARFLKKKGEGILSVAFNVKDIEEASIMAQEKGIRITDRIDLGDEVRGFRLLKEVALHPADTHGVAILLFQGELR